MADIARYLFRGSGGTGDNWPNLVRCLVNFLKKVDLLCPDFGKIDIEISCMSVWKCSYSFVMSEGPVCFVGHFKCLVLVEMLVECLVSQVSFAFLLGMHHNYARAFIRFSYGEVLILPELVQGYSFLFGDIHYATEISL